MVPAPPKKIAAVKKPLKLKGKMKSKLKSKIKTPAQAIPKKVKIKKTKKLRGARDKKAHDGVHLPRSGSTTAVGSDKLQIVPWASSSEWEHVCALFNNGEYARVISEIRIWSRRMPTIPIGVESTLYLLQAIIYDTSTNQSLSDTGLWCEEVARSLYSLAIIRYLNHVSHLATRDIADTEGGGSSTLPMSKLAAHIRVPEWIVNLRHEASHGANVPSLEVLRLAAEFVRVWLKENYWIPLDDRDKNPNSKSSKQVVLKNKSETQEAEFNRVVTLYIAAFVAVRVYKLRQYKTILDPEIMKIIQSASGSESTSVVGTNQAITILKTKISSFLRSDPARTCALLAEELVPPLDVYKDLEFILDGRSSFETLVLVWNPITKLLQKKINRLYTVLNRLIEMHTSCEEEEISSLIAQWISRLLTMSQVNDEHESRSTSTSMLQLQTLLMAPPKSSSGIFLEKLHSIVELQLGREKVQKLAQLSQIWMEDEDDDVDYKRKARLRGGAKELFTIEDIESTTAQTVSTTTLESESDFRELRSSVPNEPRLPWTLDPRPSSFWSKIPIGAIF